MQPEPEPAAAAAPPADEEMPASEDGALLVGAGLSEAELAADIAKEADHVITHMNDDHQSSILAYALVWGGDGCEDAASARISGLTTAGFVLSVALCGGGTKEGVLIPYSQPLTCAKDLHGVSIKMDLVAHCKLGLCYNLRNLKGDISAQTLVCLFATLLLCAGGAGASLLA